MFCRGCVLVPAPNLEDRRNFFHVTSVINLWGSPKCAVLQYFRLGCMSQSSPSPKTGRYIIITLTLQIFATFQSSPSPKTGRYTISGFSIPLSELSSNPHPVRRLGAILKAPLVWGVAFVPILTQSEDWALSCRANKLASVGLFQSSPSPKTGRYAYL